MPILQATAEAIGLDVSGEIHQYMKSCREANTINEFEKNDFLLCGAFPSIFMLGKAYPGSNGPLTTSQKRHLLLQFTNAAATNSELIFLLYNQQSRHNNIYGMSAKVKGNRVAFETFSRELLSNEFKERLQKAVRNPKGNDSKYVMRKIMPVLEVAGRNTKGGAVESNKLVHSTQLHLMI